MTEGEKSVISLFIIGALIVVGKVLAGGEPITARLFIGRTLLGGFVSMVAGVALVQFPDLPTAAIHGIRALPAALSVLAALSETARFAGFQPGITGQARHSAYSGAWCAGRFAAGAHRARDFPLSQYLGFIAGCRIRSA